jgi:hypothetical protein
LTGEGSTDETARAASGARVEQEARKEADYATRTADYPHPQAAEHVDHVEALDAASTIETAIAEFDIRDPEVESD